MGTPERPMAARATAAGSAIILTLSLQSGIAAAKDQGLDQGLDRDADSYSRDFGVSLEVARGRLLAQTQVGELDAVLTAAGYAWFAGVSIEHEPTWRVVVHTTVPKPDGLESAVASVGLTDSVSVRRVTYSLAALEELQRRIHAAAAPGTLMSFVDVTDNRVEVRPRTTDAWEETVKRLGVPPPESSVEVRPDAALTVKTALLGGQTLELNTGQDWCTSGFVVYRDSNPNTKGVVTAAHCEGPLYRLGTYLPLIATNMTGSHDTQFRERNGLYVDNRIKDHENGGERAITSVTGRANVSQGDYVCKFGFVQGYACGLIESKSVYPSDVVSNSNNTFILVEPIDEDMVDGGDSGGPVFVANSALGIVHGCAIYVFGVESCNTQYVDGLIYTAINYVQNGVGVTVLTN